MTRDELVSKAGVAKNGKLTRILEELEQCGFVRLYSDFVHHENDAVYQFVDAFTLTWRRDLTEIALVKTGTKMIPY